MGFGRVSGVIELRWYLGIWVLLLLGNLKKTRQGRGKGGGKRKDRPKYTKNMKNSRKAARD